MKSLSLFLALWSVNAMAVELPAVDLGDIDIGDIAVDISYDGATGAAVPADAAFVAGTDGTNLRGLHVDSSGNLQVDILSGAGGGTSPVTASGTTSDEGPVEVIASTDVSAFKTIYIQTTGSGSATIFPMGSDDGTNFLDVPATQVNQNFTATPLQGGGIYMMPVNFKYFKVSVTNPDFDTVVVTAVYTAADSTPSLQIFKYIVANTGSTSTGVASLNQTLGGDWVFGFGDPATAGKRVAAMLGVDDQEVSVSNPVPVYAPSSLDVNVTTFATGPGEVIGNAIMTTEGARTYSDSFVLDYGDDNVTTGAWVEIDPSTAGAMNMMTIFSMCGQTLELGTGAAASESRILLVPPGGIDGQISLFVASGTRLSVRGVTGDCTSGTLVMTGFN